MRTSGIEHYMKDQLKGPKAEMNRSRGPNPVPRSVLPNSFEPDMIFRKIHLGKLSVRRRSMDWLSTRNRE